MEIKTSWDDGKLLDLKLIDLLEKYEMPATFYIPNDCELSNQEIYELSLKFEVGGHTVNHPQDLKKLSDHELFFEITSNKDYLEKIIEKKIYKFCYPRGRYDKRVIKAVKDADYLEARTTKVFKLLKPKNPYETGTTIHVFQRPEYQGVDWLKLAKEYFFLAKQANDSIYHLWGHSSEVNKNKNWDKLEELFKFIKNYEKNNVS